MGADPLRLAQRMTGLNTERSLYRILRELATEHGARFDDLGQGWILRLELGTKARYVYGYAFDLTTAATHAIVTDKAAASEVLAAKGIPCVPHRVFLHPKMGSYVPHAGNWANMLAFASAHAFKLVVKENMGTGGQGVLRVSNARELELAVEHLFQRTHAVALSPFVEIAAEHRFVVLRGKVELAYTKVRPRVVGDGTSTVLELLSRGAGDANERTRIDRALAAMDPPALMQLTSVPGKGVEHLLNWRHNLGQGATPRLLEPGAAAFEALAPLAIKAAAGIELEFGSVDLVETPSGPSVLEVNSGVMMEFLARDHARGYEAAKAIYRRAFRAMFNLDA